MIGRWELYLHLINVLWWKLILVNMVFFVVAVYVSTSYLLRRNFWSDLSELKNKHIGPLLLIGYFNVVIRAHERCGKRSRPRISYEDFPSWKNANRLFHLNTTGVHFTWSNGKIGIECVSLQLDHSICDQAWLMHSC